MKSGNMSPPASFFFRIVWLDLCTYMKYYSPVRAYCLCTVLFVFRYVVSSQNTIFQSSKAMYFSSYSFCFPKYHMNKILLYIAFYGWFLSLSKICFIHVVEWINHCSLLYHWINSILCMLSHFISSSVEQHLVDFPPSF